MKTFAEEIIAHVDEQFKLGLRHDLYRSSFARGIDPAPDGEGRQGVDKNSGTIFGVAVATEGPALGHGIDLDQHFLAQLVEAGNAATQGIKARFDHPNASSTSMGTAIGRFKKFRLAGQSVRADLHLLKSAEKSPNGNYPEYLMELAQEDPQSFGTSIVFAGKPEYRLEADGTRKKGEDGQPLNPVARLEKFYAADVVDEPAANPGGLFHALSQDKLAGRLTAFLDRYFQHKGLGIPPAPASPKEPRMEPTTTTPDPNTQTLLQAAKARMFSIMKYGRKLGVPEDTLDSLMGSDEPLEQILMGLIDDAETRHFFHQKTALSLIETAPNPSAGGPGDPGVAAGKPATPAVPLSEEDAARQEFAASPDLQAEFLEADIYWAFKKNEHRTRTLRGAAEKEDA